MTASEADFTPRAYAALLATLLTRGYRAVSYAEADPAQRHVVLRHDLDQSLEDAVALSRIETERGVAATYFVLLTSPFYNPFAARGRQALRALVAGGHWIGLHHDPTVAPERPLDDAVRAGAALLAEAAGALVCAVSFHRPGTHGAPDAAEVGGLLNAYGPRFVREMGYVSDSTGRWRHGHPAAQRWLRDGRAFQLLTHPVWWMGDDAAEPRARLDRFLMRALGLLRRDLADNVTGYDPDAPLRVATDL